MGLGKNKQINLKLEPFNVPNDIKISLKISNDNGSPINEVNKSNINK